MSRSYLFVFLLVVVLHSSQSVLWQPCKGDKTLGTITDVTVDGCPQKDKPCDLVKGTNPDVTVTFTTTEEVTAINNEIHGIIAGVPIPFPLKNPDGCKDSGLKCPLESGGGPYKYQNTVNVLPSYPSVKLVIKWQMYDQNKKEIWCFEMPASVVKSSRRPNFARALYQLNHSRNRVLYRKYSHYERL